MSNRKSEQDPADRPLREAARWLVDLQDPNLSPQELLRWNEWQASRANREAFDSLESIWHVIHSDDAAASPAAVGDPEMIGEQAARWYFLCVNVPNASLADRREFLAWLRRSPVHIAELLKVAHLDGKLRKLKWLDAIKPGRTFTFKLTASAASLVVGAGLAFVTLDYMQQEKIVTTGASQWQHMQLPDGTAIHVDAHSKVAVAYTDQERIVLVYEGSAVFDVAKDPNRPFIARTDVVDAMAVGTRFGVSIGPGVTTTVSEGIVKITGRGKPDGPPVIVKAGEELRASDSTLTSLQPVEVDAKRKLQWANGLLDLSGMTVSQGVEELNRRNRTQIIVDNPALAARVVEVATVEVDSPETYAKTVAKTKGVTMIVDRANGVIRLSE